MTCHMARIDMPALVPDDTSKSAIVIAHQIEETSKNVDGAPRQRKSVYLIRDKHLKGVGHIAPIHVGQKALAYFSYPLGIWGSGVYAKLFPHLDLLFCGEKTAGATSAKRGEPQQNNEQHHKMTTPHGLRPRFLRTQEEASPFFCKPAFTRDSTNRSRRFNAKPMRPASVAFSQTEPCVCSSNNRRFHRSSGCQRYL